MFKGFLALKEEGQPTQGKGKKLQVGEIQKVLEGSCGGVNRMVVTRGPQLVE